MSSQKDQEKYYISNTYLGWPFGSKVDVSGFGEFEVCGVHVDDYGVWLKLEGWGNVDEWVSTEGVKFISD